jgi:hypothetical protein
MEPVKEAFMELAPFLKDMLTAALRGTALTIKWFGENVIKPAAQKIIEFAQTLGFIIPRARATSHGAAVRGVNTVSNLEDVFTSAAKAGLMSGVPPAEEALNVRNLKDILDRLEQKLELAMLMAAKDIVDGLKHTVFPWTK